METNFCEDCLYDNKTGCMCTKQCVMGSRRIEYSYSEEGTKEREKKTLGARIAEYKERIKRGEE